MSNASREEPVYEDDLVTLYAGDCLDVLRTLPDNSVDSVVTDPPAGIAFMSKTWDGDKGGREQWSAWLADVMREALRVTKPGGHALVWALPRTSHWTACGLEDAGWEIRDRISHLFGSGFPKSLDVSKAIDKRPGVQRHPEFAWDLTERRKAKGLSRQEVSEAVVGTRSGACWNWEHHQFPEAKWWPKLRDLLDLDEAKWGPVIAEAERAKTGRILSVTGARIAPSSFGQAGDQVRTNEETAPATDAARRWQGWGTALKPGAEDWWVARKPLTGTVAATVQEWGTGALNVDGCRVGLAPDEDVDKLNARSGGRRGFADSYVGGDGSSMPLPAGADLSKGRWPTNVVMDGDTADELDAEVGTLTSGKLEAHHVRNPKDVGILGAYGSAEGERGYGDSGGPSRFFPVFRYQAKAPTRERVSYVKDEADDTWAKSGFRKRCTKCGKQEVNVPGSMCTCPEPDFQVDPSMRGKVSHPTVKPLALMRWLVRLVTPPGGVVLEPFAGSGTTVEAAILEGFQCIAIEREADYLPLILQRIERNRITSEGVPAVEALTLWDDEESA